MNLEEKNRRKRAKATLSKMESLEFFILPFMTPRAQRKLPRGKSSRHLLKTNF